jgi:hypothetical protein
MKTATKTLICHYCRQPISPPPAGSCTTGYGITSNGWNVCYPCCLKRDLAAMKTEKRFVAYLSTDCREIHNWPGDTLAKVTSCRKIRHNWAHCPPLFAVRAVDANGGRWYGRGLGGSMYIRLHRTVQP